MGKDGEIGLMQVMRPVGREVGQRNRHARIAEQMNSDPQSILRDPNETFRSAAGISKKSTSVSGQARSRVRMIAAYNAGPSRAVERAGPIHREIHNRARSSSTASTFLRRGVRDFDHARYGIEEHDVSAAEQLHQSNDDYLLGALGASWSAPRSRMARSR
jgi:hypothetical protein